MRRGLMLWLSILHLSSTASFLVILVSFVPLLPFAELVALPFRVEHQLVCQLQKLFVLLSSFFSRPPRDRLQRAIRVSDHGRYGEHGIKPASVIHQLLVGSHSSLVCHLCLSSNASGPQPSGQMTSSSSTRGRQCGASVRNHTNRCLRSRTARISRSLCVEGMCERRMTTRASH